MALTEEVKKEITRTIKLFIAIRGFEGEEVPSGFWKDMEYHLKPLFEKEKSNAESRAVEKCINAIHEKKGEPSDNEMSYEEECGYNDAIEEVIEALSQVSSEKESTK